MAKCSRCAVCEISKYIWRTTTLYVRLRQDTDAQWQRNRRFFISNAICSFVWVVNCSFELVFIILTWCLGFGQSWIIYNLQLRWSFFEYMFNLIVTKLYLRPYLGSCGCNLFGEIGVLAIVKNLKPWNAYNFAIKIILGLFHYIVDLSSCPWRRWFSFVEGHRDSSPRRTPNTSRF